MTNEELIKNIVEASMDRLDFIFERTSIAFGTEDTDESFLTNDDRGSKKLPLLINREEECPINCAIAKALLAGEEIQKSPEVWRLINKYSMSDTEDAGYDRVLGEETGMLYAYGRVLEWMESPEAVWVKAWGLVNCYPSEDNVDLKPFMNPNQQK